MGLQNYIKIYKICRARLIFRNLNNNGGETHGGLRHCRYEWVEQTSDACKYRNSAICFCPEELGRRDAGYLFEEACKVMWVLEAKQECGFAYIVAVHQEALALL